MSDHDVIIVGAGHNGLTAAVELQRAGHQVLVLEKTSWPGGHSTAVGNRRCRHQTCWVRWRPTPT